MDILCFGFSLSNHMHDPEACSLRMNSLCPFSLLHLQLLGLRLVPLGEPRQIRRSGVADSKFDGTSVFIFITGSRGRREYKKRKTRNLLYASMHRF